MGLSFHVLQVFLLSSKLCELTSLSRLNFMDRSHPLHPLLVFSSKDNIIEHSRCLINDLELLLTLFLFPWKIRNHLIEHSNLGCRKEVLWNEKLRQFQPNGYSNRTEENMLFQSINFLRNSFLPSGDLTNDYYKYTCWRAAQRLVGATLGVFGTQALLLALGFKKSSIGALFLGMIVCFDSVSVITFSPGLAAATTWVLKDALGKFSRIFWASRNGRKFDCDAKKWRFRSSLLFAAGNALEIITFLVPSLFLLIAALANGLKQMAMLTSSATRNTMYAGEILPFFFLSLLWVYFTTFDCSYKSFSTKSDNIGDITAKGEAQIAVIDLIGMVIGIGISRIIGTSRAKIVAVFTVLTFFDLFCVSQEIQRFNI